MPENYSNFQSGGILQKKEPEPQKKKEIDESESENQNESESESESETEKKVEIKQRKKQEVETKQKKQAIKQQLELGAAAQGYPRPPGAVSYASLKTYQQQYPPPPPYGQYEYNSPPPYQYQYPPPSPPQYQYRGGYGGAPPQKAGGRYGYYGGYQMPRGGHDYYGGGGRGYDGYYEEYHGPGYPGQFPPPNQGGYNYGMSRNDSRSLQDVNQVDAVKKHAHERNHDGGQKATGGVVVAAAGIDESESETEKKVEIKQRKKQEVETKQNKQTKPDNYSNFQSGWILSGRDNVTNGCARAEPKPQKKEQGYAGGHGYNHGAGLLGGVMGLAGASRRRRRPRAKQQLNERAVSVATVAATSIVRAE